MATVSEAKKRIVIASVLKPVDDTRMTEKMGNTLARTGAFDVSIIGFQTTSGEPARLDTHELPYFRRISSRRLVIPWSILQKIIQLKPHLLIITTHELLWISVLAQWFTGTKVIYDIQENYYRNIMFTPAFPAIIRPLVASYVRWKERITASWVDHFFLAEKKYAEELPFVRNKFTVLENKLKKPVTRLDAERDKYQLLFSGTLAESTGVLKAIEIAAALHSLERRISLVIVGYCSQRLELKKIEKAIAPFPFIKLRGGDILVPHKRILDEIQYSGAGIISYPKNKSTEGSIPTKLYEYLGMQLPILLINHPPWVNLCKPYNAAFVFDSDTFDARTALQALETQHFYPNEPLEVYWESEENKLNSVVKQIVS